MGASAANIHVETCKCERGGCVLWGLCEFCFSYTWLHHAPQVLSHPKIVVPAIPVFHVFVRGSKFRYEWGKDKALELFGERK